MPAIRSSGVSTEELRRHYVFVTEYLWGVVETDFDHGQALTVLDVQGLGMRDLAGEALGFVKVSLGKERLPIACICNAFVCLHTVDGKHRTHFKVWIPPISKRD